MADRLVDADMAIGGPVKFATGRDVLATTSFAPRVMYAVPVKDNSEFVTKFDKDVFKDVVSKHTKTIVVDQVPGHGELVPAGTPINLVLTVKGDIPVGSFRGVDVAVAGKYANIGALQADLEDPEDSVAKDAKGVLDKDLDYKDLSANDKGAVDNFLKNRFGAEAVDTEEKKTKIYSDTKFLVHL